MPQLIIHNEKITDPIALTTLCPFNALEVTDGQLNVTAACKMCKLCVKKDPAGVFEYCEDDALPQIDKSLWRGLAVYVDHEEGEIHPVTLELIGKARELAAKIDHPVYALMVGHNIAERARELLHYGVDKVFVYDAPELNDFRIEPYTACFEAFIKQVSPTIVLVGGTTVGRSLAPRTAARFRTGLTADCTTLEIQPNTDLDQIRPAFGGNIMAHIRTPNHRPQFATVRYKIFSAPEKLDVPRGELVLMPLDNVDLSSAVTVLETRPKAKVKSIEDAEVIIAAGRGIKNQDNLKMLEQLAERLGGMLACTRPLIEMGWVDPRRQIGLSGRTVKPKLIITCGISGAIQFVAGMNGAENIISINNDPNAAIFNVAHQAIIGDVTEIIPRLLEQIDSGKSALAGLQTA
jgi:electron transfer flavoprotein alpha subunit